MTLKSATSLLSRNPVILVPTVWCTSTKVLSRIRTRRL